MKRILLLLSAAFIVSLASAQQLPHYTQYFLNDYVMNPAIGGSRPYFEGKSNNRYQWVGITDAPRTYVLSLHGPLNNRKMGVGGYLFSDITGPTRRTGFQLSYSYHLNIKEGTKLSFGVSGGMLQFLVDGSKVGLREGGDLAWTNANMSVLLLDATAGLYLYSDNFWFGLSAPQLIPNKIQYFEDYPETASQMVNHYFVSGGYKINLMDNFTIEPSVSLKYVSPVPPQIAPTLRFIYNDMIWAGGSYRTSFQTDDALGLMFGYVFQENLTIGYSYDLIQSNLKNYSSGSHELMIGVRFKNRTNPPPKASME